MISFYNIKMSEKTVKFGNVIVHKKEFYASKKAIALNLVHLENLNIMTKVLSIVLVTEKIISLDLYILFYVKWVDT